MVKILSNTRMMAPTLTLHLLSLVLFFFTNGQGISARNLKTELQDQKQFDWGGHQDKQSEDPNQLFISGVHEANSKDLEDKQPKDLNQLLVWGGHQDKQSKDPNQLFASGVHEANSKDLEDKQPKDPNQLLVWGGHQDKQSKDLNQLFASDVHEANPKDLEDKQPGDPNQLLVWGGHEDKQPKDPNQLLVWGNREANSKDLDDHPSSNLDHTEAFKLGFFGLDDLHVGNVMALQFPVQKVPQFLSKKEANSIPFSLS
ncbi:putative BURP domain-containing protein [Medicago truncatula]|uniref:Putative BURP domain-containing protein n=1 Tax=Medicago truncatula TaxID=3880 RepID=A0A396I6F6_MEDTR|nr:putative BURP domain-containing protein [Medicago truncatula]